jgi:hypothetical protein
MAVSQHYYSVVLRLCQAGAAVGYLTARGELSQRRGLILAPVIEPTPRRS